VGRSYLGANVEALADVPRAGSHLARAELDRVPLEKRQVRTPVLVFSPARHAAAFTLLRLRLVLQDSFSALFVVLFVIFG
jgi:hypothetical protein